MSKWQPIESAPTDGTRILICVSGFENSVWIAKDKGVRKRIWFSGGRRLHMNPTHWMPLPEPPDA